MSSEKLGFAGLGFYPEEPTCPQGPVAAQVPGSPARQQGVGGLERSLEEVLAVGLEARPSSRIRFGRA
jgi:hypothetical protein